MIFIEDKQVENLGSKEIITTIYRDTTLPILLKKIETCVTKIRDSYVEDVCVDTKYIFVDQNLKETDDYVDFSVLETADLDELRLNTKFVKNIEYLLENNLYTQFIIKEEDCWIEESNKLFKIENRIFNYKGNYYKFQIKYTFDQFWTGITLSKIQKVEKKTKTITYWE